MKIENIVGQAFKILGKELSMKAIENNWFVTCIEEVDLEGNKQKLALIDTTRTISLNYENFIEQSKLAYSSLSEQYWIK